MNIRKLDAADYGYAVFSFREGAKKAPGFDRVPFSYFKDTVVRDFEKLLDDPNNVALGAYTHEEKLIGWLLMTPSKRVPTVHWLHVKHEIDGKSMRRRGAMTALLGEVGSRFAYTFRARRDRAKLPDGSTTKSLDESLVAALRARGISATYVPYKEWSR